MTSNPNKKSKEKSNSKAKREERQRREARKNRDILDITNDFLEKRVQFFAFIGLFSIVILGFLLFDIRVDLGGDDSDYIKRAYDFIHKGVFPTFQGPLYPILISIPIWLFGINIPLVKLFSFLFVTIGVLIFFRALRHRFPPLLVGFVTVMVATNSYILYFTSQTYTEALFFLVQSVFLFYFIRLFIEKKTPFSLRNDRKTLIIMAALLLMLILVKSIGILAVGCCVGFLVLEKRWKEAAALSVIFVVIYFSYGAVRNWVWDLSGSQFQNQARMLLQKNPYQVSEGQEDLAGFFQRFIDNSNLYLSRHLYMFMGLRGYYKEVIPRLTWLSYGLLLMGGIWGWKRNKTLMFFALYCLGMMAGSFFLLQKAWDQWRIIINYFPLLLVVFGCGIYYLFKTRYLKMLQPFFILFLVVLVFFNFHRTTGKVQEHFPILRANMRGDMLMGYTQDWRNFIEMSKWAAEHVPAGKVIASRKPGISFVWSNGREFKGIFKVPSQDPDTLLQYLRDHEMEFVIMASLRKYPSVKTKETITTIRNILYLVQQKYPARLRMVHQIGGNDDEPATLFQLDLR